MFVKIDIKINNMDKLSYYEKCQVIIPYQGFASPASESFSFS